MDNTKATIEDLRERLEICHSQMAELKQSVRSQRAEKNVAVRFEGWLVDLFLCDNGDLGLTVERHQAGMKFPDDDNPSRDIFINQTTLSVRAV